MLKSRVADTDFDDNSPFIPTGTGPNGYQPIRGRSSTRRASSSSTPDKGFICSKRVRGYLPNRWPSWFDPAPLDLTAEPFGPFARSRRVTQAGDIVAVATPGHTANHVSILVQEGDTTFVLAGDTSYNEALMLGGKVDGVSSNERVSKATLDAIKNFTRSRPTVYLPTHDPQSGNRLANRRLVSMTDHAASQAA